LDRSGGETGRAPQPARESERPLAAAKRSSVWRAFAKAHRQAAGTSVSEEGSDP
jgi:hypothetical protein